MIDRPAIGRAIAHGRDRLRSSHPQPGSQDGFLLIEVIISSLLVALVVVSTLTGFDVLNRTTADQRHHDQAAILAAQSQEQLRTDPASALNALQVTPHKYTVTAGGTTYTITQSASSIASTEQSTSCSATLKTRQSGSYMRITSSVTWPQLARAKRAEVTQSSIVTPPAGSALEVDVGNAPAPTAGVAGVTAVVTYTPLGSGSSVTLEATTGPAGCLVFTGLRATSATVAIKEKPGFVTPSGALKIAPKEVTIVPNLTTHYSVTLNEGGAIRAEFTYKGATTYEGKQVNSDTFVVATNSINAPPEFEVGSTSIEYEKAGEEPYKALTGKYEPTAETPKTANYPQGDLFPFPSAAWSVYAGDCPNKYNITKEAVASEPPEILVAAGKTTTVKVPTSYVLLSVWKGTKEAEGLTKERFPVKITSVECEASATPNNAFGKTFIHEQKETSAEAHLEYPFQPFGAYTLCIANKPVKKTYTIPYTNSTTVGSSPKIYLGQRSAVEKTELREKRAKEEEEARVAKEKAENTAREKREGEEKVARENWKAEEKAKIINKKQREEREKIQKEARIKIEAAEKVAKEKREKEEKTAKEKREAEEKVESEEAAKTGVTVQSGKETC